LNDLDRNKITGLQAARQLDLAMDATADLADDFVLIDQLSSSDEVLFDLRLVSPG
jgi:hypothetical protein